MTYWEFNCGLGVRNDILGEGVLFTPAGFRYVGDMHTYGDNGAFNTFSIVVRTYSSFFTPVR